MEIREAVEADAERMADIAESPADVMRNLIHDRTVRVACTGGDDDASDETGDEGSEASGDGDDVASDGDGDGQATDADTGGDPDAGGDADADAGGEILALVSFDALDDTVHVTQLAGPPDACERLLEEPIRFAEREEMSVELLVPSGDDDAETAARAAGFASVGSGPEFEDRETTRYRLEPGKAEQ